jgi:hypothetical protein
MDVNIRYLQRNPPEKREYGSHDDALISTGQEVDEAWRNAGPRGLS